MMNPLNFVLFGIGAVILLQWVTYRLVLAAGTRKIRQGDIVLYVDPEGDITLNNMITQVLHVFPRCGTVLIRATGTTGKGSTTAVVPTRHLQLLCPDRSLPIRVPGEPLFGLGKGRCNQAEWNEIPLDWFPYEIPHTIPYTIPAQASKAS